MDAALAGLGSDPDAVDLGLWVLHNRLALLNNLGRREEFEQTAGRTLILAGRVGTVQAGRIQWAAAMGCYDFGAWDEALIHLDSLQRPLSDARQIGRHGLAALIAAHREEWEGVGEHVQAGAASRLTPGDVGVRPGHPGAAPAHPAPAA